MSEFVADYKFNFEGSTHGVQGLEIKRTNSTQSLYIHESFGERFLRIAVAYVEAVEKETSFREFPSTILSDEGLAPFLGKYGYGRDISSISYRPKASERPVAIPQRGQRVSDLVLSHFSLPTREGPAVRYVPMLEEMDRRLDLNFAKFAHPHGYLPIRPRDELVIHPGEADEVIEILFTASRLGISGLKTNTDELGRVLDREYVMMRSRRQ